MKRCVELDTKCNAIKQGNSGELYSVLFKPNENPNRSSSGKRSNLYESIRIILLTLIANKLLANFWEISCTVLLENSSNRQLESSEASHRPFYWKTHPDQMLHMICNISYYMIHIWFLSKNSNG